MAPLLCVGWGVGWCGGRGSVHLVSLVSISFIFIFLKFCFCICIVFQFCFLKGFLVLFWCPSGHVSLLCLVLISLDAQYIAEFSMHIFPVLCLFFFVQRCCSCLFGRARGYRCCFFVCFMPSSFLAHLDPFVLYEIHLDPLALCIFALVKSRRCCDLCWFDLLCCSVFNLSIFDQFLVVRFFVVIYQSFIWLFQCAIRPCFSSSHLSIFIR